MNSSPLPDESAPTTPQAPLSILCVDDESNILNTLRRLFRNEEYQVLTATSGEEGLAILKTTENIGLILSDQRMPEMTGSEFLQEARELFPDISRLILTGYTDVGAAMDAINRGGAYRFLTKPWNGHELRQAVQDGLHRYMLTRENQRLNELVRRKNVELAEWNTNLKNRVLQQTAQLRQKLKDEQAPANDTNSAAKNVVSAFTYLLGRCGARTTNHYRTVAALADRMVQHLELDEIRSKQIRTAAILHDLGTIGMSDRLLSKGKDQMTPDELREYRSHPVVGQTALEQFGELREIGIFIRHHHEAHDGSGFPDGLAGEKIPLGARIIALADWIETTFSRDYRHDARYQLSKLLAQEMGRLFDPALTTAANVAIMQVLRDPPVLRDMSEEEISVQEISSGMIVSRNVYSKGGTLLLDRGTRLDFTDVESLRRQQLSGQLSETVQVLRTSIITQK
jgi:response regulator RpfG family c-di-GMP phosphodiesterase